MSAPSSATSMATSSTSARPSSRRGTPAHDGFEHFAWGVTPELAGRIGQRAGDFELETERRRDYLTDLATAGVTGVADVRNAIDGYRHAAPSRTSAAATSPN